jgi:tetratricopeptide (TPR) repeat protein
MYRMIAVLMLVMAAFIATPGLSLADETSPAEMEKTDKPQNKAVVSLYDQGIDESNKNDFQKALPLFEQALRADPNNPDVLNMLAHTQRKIGMIDEALANYKKALELRPRFPEAHEYLGEAYIQAALREIETLKSYGNDGHEELEDLNGFMKDAAQKI